MVKGSFGVGGGGIGGVVMGVRGMGVGVRGRKNMERMVVFTLLVG